jgi:hypothetical protein
MHVDKKVCFAILSDVLIDIYYYLYYHRIPEMFYSVNLVFHCNMALNQRPYIQNFFIVCNNTEALALTTHSFSIWF